MKPAQPVLTSLTPASRRILLTSAATDMAIERLSADDMMT